MKREIVFSNGKWYIAENVKIATCNVSGNCFLGDEILPEIGDFIFMDCSDNGFSEKIFQMGLTVELVSHSGRGQAFFVIKKPVCICEFENGNIESIVQGRVNDAGGFSCPHFP